MRLTKAHIQGYRSIIDSGYFDVESEKTIMVGPNEAGKTALLQALQKLNPPEGIELFNPLRDYPRSKYDEDIKNGKINPNEFTVVEGHFTLEDVEKDALPEAYRSITYIYGRHLDNSTWHRLDNSPQRLAFSEVEKDLQRMIIHFQSTAIKLGATEQEILAMSTEYEALNAGLTKTSLIPVETASKIQGWLKKHLKYVEEENSKEEARYDSLQDVLNRPLERNTVLQKCEKMLPKFILFSNYFRIRPTLHLRKLADRIANNSLDDAQYDYGNTCLLKFLGFTAEELAKAGETEGFNLNDPVQYEKYKAQLDDRDYRLNAATIRLTDAIREVWNPSQDSRDANKLRIKADGQYLKVVVEDELGVEVELDQRSEGFQWMVSFYVVFFAEAKDKHKNAILLLDEPGQSLHALKQAEFQHTLSKLSEKNQTIYTTHSPFLVGANELDRVRVIEMANRREGSKVHLSLTAADSGAILPLQEALGYDLAQSMFFHKKNLVLEGLTDMWYIESISDMLKASGKKGLEGSIALIPAGCASKVVYFATILHSQDLKIAALLDSDAEGDLAANQDILVNALGSKKILRTKDVYAGTVKKVEIEDILRETLIKIAKTQLGWDAEKQAKGQTGRPVVDILFDVAKDSFSKYKLAKAFIKWSRDNSLENLSQTEIMQSEKLIKKINQALS